MTKFDLVLERLLKLPPAEREAIAAEIELRLDNAVEGSAFTDQQWAEIEKTFDEDGEEIPHEQVFAEMRAKFPA